MAVSFLVSEVLFQEDHDDAGRQRKLIDLRRLEQEKDIENWLFGASQKYFKSIGNTIWDSVGKSRDSCSEQICKQAHIC